MWALQGLTVAHAVAGADDVVEDDELGEGQGIALAQLAADGEDAELVEAVPAILDATAQARALHPAAGR